MPRAGAIVAVIIACAAVPAGAAAHDGDGLFTLARDLANATDVTMLPDATVVIAEDSRVVVLAPDGTRGVLPGVRATGLATAPDGSVLAVDSTTNVVWRWLPGIRPEVVAGRARGGAGFGGDGGPATRAKLRLFSGLSRGIVGLPGGGFRFTDTGNQRIREVDAAGIIRTVAGTGRTTPGGDGGPAAAASITDPAALAATPDGGYLIGGPDRIRSVAPDGTISTLADAFDEPSDLVVPSDGRPVVTDEGLGGLWRWSGTAFEPFLANPPAAPRDFAARAAPGNGVGTDGAGGLLLAGGEQVAYAPAGDTRWALIGLRDTRVLPEAITATVEATRSGAATLEVLRRGRVVARATADVPAGHSTLAAPLRTRSRWYRVRVRLGRSGDSVAVHGARSLTPRLARRLVGRDLGDYESGSLRYGRCRAFGARRVDCAVRFREAGFGAPDPRGCFHVLSLSLPRTGVALLRGYECASVRRARFRRAPRWTADVEMRALGPRPGYR